MNKHQKMINRIAKLEVVAHEKCLGDKITFREMRKTIRETMKHDSFERKKAYWKHWSVRDKRI